MKTRRWRLHSSLSTSISKLFATFSALYNSSTIHIQSTLIVIVPPPICLWSGPRNVSTALMYSFAQRTDMCVIDEPLYGHYLGVTGAEHPGREEIIAAMNCDGDAVMRELLQQAGKSQSTILFIKHMAHHLVQIDLRFLQQTNNIFLIRDPREMLPSLNVQLPHATLADTGLQKQWQLLQDLRSNGHEAVVLDSRELLLDPESVLRQLCDKLGIEFEQAMLQWTAGPRAEDGVWAKHWYQAVHKSTGFSAYQAKTHFPTSLDALLEECQPWYDKLFALAIRAQQ